MQNVLTGDLLGTAHTIHSIQKLHQESMQELGKWQVNFSVEIIPSTMSIKVTASKPNGKGIIRTIDFSDVEYYSNDPDSLVQMAVEDAYNALIKQELINELGPLLTRAITNSVKMKNK